jgi:predicted alpha/beta-fold hydrolase
VPISTGSFFRPPTLQFNAHLQTVIPNTMRRVTSVRYRRQRIATADGDFLDLDWSEVGSGRLAVLCHGLEGDSHRPYILGMASYLNDSGWDVLAWNFRGCSGVVNDKPRCYHAGDTEDLQTVLEFSSGRNYSALGLVGFSIGANMVVRFLGDRRSRIPENTIGAVAISAPCDLESSTLQLHRLRNRPYLRRFLRMLKAKVRAKALRYPDLFDLEYLARVQDFKQFDDQYTAPLHGFKDAVQYWRESGCVRALASLELPVLMIIAGNDTFLGPECFPFAEATRSDNLFLEVATAGGHVGFAQRGGGYWSEIRTAGFLAGLC